MKAAVTSFAAAVAAALVLSATPATSADHKTWYVYCEGARQGDHLAIFSENFWGHPASEGYGRRVGSIAKDFFEARHDIRLDGCAAVNFVDFTLAEHSRNRTAQLHRSMGDRVLYYRLPDDALPTDFAEAAAPRVVEVRAEPVAAPSAVADTRPVFTPKRAER